MSGRTTATITFYCRESKVDRNGFAPIEAVITLNGKRSVISMPILLILSDRRFFELSNLSIF